MKNLKKMRNVVAVVLALVMVLNPMKVFAEEVPTEARYDLTKGGTQTFVIRGEDGEVGTVTVEELSGDSRIADGNYRISYDNTVWQAAFSVSISNNKFYNAYNPYSFAAIGDIRFPALTRPSTTNVVYAFIYESISMMYSTGVDAKITNGELVVKKR